jgi:uncharacterized protein (TIGR03435 family)
MSVKLMFSFLFRVPLRQISGGPNWLESARWDIDAKASQSYHLDDLHAMFQHLLVDEFKLDFHKEVREGPVYALRIDKAGLKMKVDHSDEELKDLISYGKTGEAIGTRVPIEYLCWWLAQRLGTEERPVIDRTGLREFYDFRLRFLPELPPGYDVSKLPPGMADLPSIFVALREHLGLRLESQKGPIEIYVIDQAERPAVN